MLTINRELFLKLMDEQARIGGTPDGGVSRPALSLEDIQVRAWFRDRIESSGLTYHMDGAGNQIGRLACDDPDAKTLLIGSHLDSVPDGGRFDGALGVLAGFAALLAIKESAYTLPFHLEVINFTDEEGALQGMLGSKAMTGQLTREGLQSPRGGYSDLLNGFERLGITEETVLSAQRDLSSLLGYLEVHIEQGTRLQDAGLNIGVVTSIVGIRSYWLHFHGEAAHAGTQSMEKRRDAFWGAAAFVGRAREYILRDYLPGVVNFGQIKLTPGAFNIVPKTASLAMEFRHGEATLLNAMERDLLALAEDSAEDFHLTLTHEYVSDIAPAPMTPAFVDAVETAAGRLGLSSTRLMSFAGHDAQSLAGHTQSVMFFVPSVGGVSHNPREYTTPDDCVNAANVILHSVLEIAGLR